MLLPPFVFRVRVYSFLHQRTKEPAALHVRGAAKHCRSRKRKKEKESEGNEELTLGVCVLLECAEKGGREGKGGFGGRRHISPLRTSSCSSISFFFFMRSSFFFVFFFSFFFLKKRGPFPGALKGMRKTQARRGPCRHAILHIGFAREIQCGVEFGTSKTDARDTECVNTCFRYMRRGMWRTGTARVPAPRVRNRPVFVRTRVGHSIARRRAQSLDSFRLGGRTRWGLL